MSVVAPTVPRGTSALLSLLGGKRKWRGHRQNVVNDPEPTLNWQFPINLYSWVHALRQHCGLICKHPFSPL